MKKARTAGIAIVITFLSLLVSCLKEGDETLLVHDPQIVPFITDTNLWPYDLLTLFGEEYVNFGDDPPSMDFAFKLERQQYATTNLDASESPTIGSFSPIPHLHKFRNQYLQMCQYAHEMTVGPNNKVINRIDTVFLMGSGSRFTAYFHEYYQTAGSPVHAVILSGTLIDSTAVTDYRYGYKIISYADEHVPSNAYPQNSIFIFQSTDTLAIITPNP